MHLKDYFDGIIRKTNVSREASSSSNQYELNGWTYYYTGSVWFAKKGDTYLECRKRESLEAHIRGEVESEEPSMPELDLFEVSENVSRIYSIMSPSGEIAESLSESAFNQLLTKAKNGTDTYAPIPSRGYPRHFEHNTELRNKYKFEAFLPRGKSLSDEYNPCHLVSSTEGTCTDQFTGIKYPANSVEQRNVYKTSGMCAKETLEKYNLVWVRDLQTYISKNDTSFELVCTNKNEYFQLKCVLDNDDIFARCAATDRWTRDSVIMYNGDIWCRTWFDIEGFTCDDCGENFPKETHYSGRGLCVDCHVPDFDELVGDYGNRAESLIGWVDEKGNKHKSDVPKKKRFYGLELEMYAENERETANALREIINSKLAIACHDSSLDNHEGGFELKTPPVSYRQISDHVEKIFDILGENNLPVMTDKSCGVHIHVSKESLSQLQIARLFTFFYNKFNRNLLEFVAGRKADSFYCQFHQTRSQVTLERKKYKAKNILGKEERLLQYTVNSDDKYRAIHTGKTHTVEFRLFGGSVDKATVMSYIEFIKAILAFSAISSGNKMLKHEFLRTINRKEHPNLHKRLCEGGFLKQKEVPSKYKTAKK